MLVAVSLVIAEVAEPKIHGGRAGKIEARNGDRGAARRRPLRWADAAERGRRHKGEVIGRRRRRRPPSRRHSDVGGPCPFSR